MQVHGHRRRIDGDVGKLTAALPPVAQPPLIPLLRRQEGALGQNIQRTTGFPSTHPRQEQQNLSTYFAGGWKEPEPPPFTFDPFEGGPLLSDSGAALGCSVETIHEGGDHYIVVGRVQAMFRREDAWAPLVFATGKYVSLAEEKQPL